MKKNRMTRKGKTQEAQDSKAVSGAQRRRYTCMGIPAISGNKENQIPNPMLPWF